MPEKVDSKLLDQLTEVYNTLCRSALNKEYYGSKLHSTQRLNDTLEILIAVGATGSGISAFTIWSMQPFGPWIWGGLTSISALLAVLKPIIQLNKKIERLSRLYSGHSDNYANLLIIVSRIRRSGAISPELNSLFESAEARFVDLSKEDDPQPNLKLLRRCEAIVRDRHPADAAWYPDASSSTLVQPQQP